MKTKEIDIIQTDAGFWVGVIFTDSGIYQVTDVYPNEWEVQDDIDNGLIDETLLHED